MPEKLKEGGSGICPKCGNGQFYITKLTPLYLFDEDRALVCDECGYDVWSKKNIKEIEKERKEKSGA